MQIVLGKIYLSANPDHSRNKFPFLASEFLSVQNHKFLSQKMSWNLLVTYFQEFLINESTIFFMKNVLFSFKGDGKCLFVKINSFSNSFDLKENKKNVVKKILRFRISENMSWTSYCFLLKELQSVFFKKINSFSNIFNQDKKNTSWF